MTFILLIKSHFDIFKISIHLNLIMFDIDTTVSESKKYTFIKTETVPLYVCCVYETVPEIGFFKFNL